MRSQDYKNNYKIYFEVEPLSICISFGHYSFISNIKGGLEKNTIQIREKKTTYTSPYIQHILFVQLAGKGHVE